MILKPESAKSLILGVTKAVAGNVAASMAANTFNQVYDKLVSMGCNLDVDPTHPVGQKLLDAGKLQTKE